MKSLILIFVFFLTDQIFPGNANCLESISSVKLFRLPRTRFYVAQPSTVYDGIDWEDAKQVCSNYGLNLASIDSYGEDAVVGHALELFAKKNKDAFKITKSMKFWIDAKYNPVNQSYIWVRENKPLNFQSIMYEGQKPVGFGNDLSKDGNIFKPVVKDLPEMCLGYQIKFVDNLETPFRLGYETLMEETPCNPLNNVEKRFALCEGLETNCPNPDEKKINIFTDSKNYYMYNGLWVFGKPRKYVVNFLPRTQSESVNFCESKGLKIYRPDNKESCITQFITLWNKRIGTAKFWTDLKSFIPRSKLHNDQMQDVCFGINFNLEVKTNDDCNFPNESQTSLVPANCYIKMATICVHKNTSDEKTNEVGEDNKCSCRDIWGMKENISKLLESKEGKELIINNTHTIPFGSEDKNYYLYRSTFKQTFGNRICPENYILAYEVTELPLPDQIKEFKYDGLEEYWVRDYVHSVGATGNNCMTKAYNATENQWVVRKGVDCNEWYFYLCVHREHRGRRSVNHDIWIEEYESVNYFADWM